MFVPTVERTWVSIYQWFPTWGPRKAVRGPQDVLRSMGGGPWLKKVGNRWYILMYLSKFIKQYVFICKVNSVSSYTRIIRTYSIPEGVPYNRVILYLVYVFANILDEPKRPKTVNRHSPSYDTEEMAKASPDLELELEPTPIRFQPVSRSIKPPKREYHPVLTGNDVRDKIIEMIVDSFKKNIPPGMSLVVLVNKFVIIYLFMYLELVYDAQFYKLASEIEENILSHLK